MQASSPVALVTGSSRGIGLEIAKRLARDGMNVACAATSKVAAEAAAEIVHSMYGVETIGVALRVEDLEEVERGVAAVSAQLGTLTVLVNNAGVTGVAPLLDVSVAEFSHQVDVNLKGAFNCARTVAQRMVESGHSGSIIQIGSIAGVSGFPARIGYCSSKAALHHMTSVMALDLAKDGIRVNCVAPGYVHTEMVSNLISDGTLDVGALERRIPLGRFGSVEDVAAAVSWLASSEADYVTGTTLFVDGGWTAYGHI